MRKLFVEVRGEAVEVCPGVVNKIAEEAPEMVEKNVFSMVFPWHRWHRCPKFPWVDGFIERLETAGPL